MAQPEPPQTIETFLSRYPAPVRALALAARDLIRAVMPDTVEQLDPSANLIAYGLDTSYRGLICGIVIYPAYINLMFARGVSLPDPAGLLTGTGKKARHIQVRQAADLAAPAVRELLVQALILARA